MIGYDLTTDEVAALNALDPGTMALLAGSLDERISKAFIAGWTIAMGGGKGKSLSKLRRKVGRVGGPQRHRCLAQVAARKGSP